MPLAPLPRIENVSNSPFWPVAPTPGTRVMRSWKSCGAAIASWYVRVSVASAEGQSAAVPLAVTVTASPTQVEPPSGAASGDAASTAASASGSAPESAACTGIAAQAAKEKAAAIALRSKVGVTWCSPGLSAARGGANPRV